MQRAVYVRANGVDYLVLRLAPAKIVKHEIGLDIIAQVVQTEPIEGPMERSVHAMIVEDVYIKVEVNHVGLYVTDVIVTYA
jgi:hypothetical protein